MQAKVIIMFDFYTQNHILAEIAQDTKLDVNTVVVGIVIPRTGSLIFDDHYHLELIQSIARECGQKEYTVCLFLFHSRGNKKRLYSHLLRPGFCDGLIVSSSQVDDPLIPILMEQNLKFVTIGKQPDWPQVSYVGIDNERGAYKAVNHLIQQGYQRIATITGPQNIVAGIERRHGYLNALQDYGYAIDETLMIEGKFTESSGYASMKALLRQYPDAVFVASDTMALGALQAIREAGLSVPHDIALVGFDDIKTAVITSPPLTTIRQPINETGKIAVSLLLDMLENNKLPVHHKTLETELIIRQSCGFYLHQ
jgi:LacI family transcriptional regulator